LVPRLHGLCALEEPQATETGASEFLISSWTAPVPARFTIVTLSEKEYFATVERLGEKGLAKNYIYDGLIMSAAEKSGAAIIYTWNTADFLKVSPPSVFSRIRTP